VTRVASFRADYRWDWLISNLGGNAGKKYFEP
jgi:hypothetical protein